MANFVYICGKQGFQRSYSDADVRAVGRAISPDNAPSTTEIVRADDSVLCTVNPSSAVDVRDTSICLGELFPRSQQWERPGVQPPRGSYAIVRSDEATVEVVSDGAASRTVFYYFDEEKFLASTSQRAIVHFLDDFVPNPSAIPWMISTGSLGPAQSWDERLQFVPPNSRVELRKSDWDLNVRRNSLTFAPRDVSPAVHRERLEESLETVFSNLELEVDQWILPLSGGLDSRELLLQLQDEGIDTVTWGTADAMSDPQSDASLARELASACGVSHEYYELPERIDDPELFFDRFLTAGEGRIDHLMGYTDKFEYYAGLAQSDRVGMIRGDEGFGWMRAASPDWVRHLVGLDTIDDYERLPSLPIPHADDQRLPPGLQRGLEETLALWRDRLYHTYRIPTILSALNDLKAPYVEVVNPFLAQNVLECVRQFPDDLRTNKKLYTEYVLDRSPDIPVATRSADPSVDSVLSSPKVSEHLQTTLDRTGARTVLGDGLVEYAVNQLETETDGSGSGSSSILNALKYRAGRQVPDRFVEYLVSYTPVSYPDRVLSDTRLALRLYIICEMHRRLAADAEAL